jgi:hypothetical protein
MWSRSFVVALALTVAQTAVAQAPDRDYIVLVVSEAVDVITTVRFGPGADQRWQRSKERPGLD